MTHDLVLENGLVVAPGGAFHGGVAIEGDSIVALGATSTLGPGRREIDLVQDGEIVEDRPAGRFIRQVVRPRGLA